MKYVLGAVVVAALVLWIVASASPDKRERCNAEGDVRYIGSSKYMCERTPSSGLRWTWTIGLVR